MSGGLIDKVYIGLGLDNAPAAFDIKGRILGPNGTNLEYIRSETGVVAVLKSDKFEPLHLALHHTRSEALSAARSLAQNLIETIRAELAQWTAAQAGGPPPAMNVPPPTLTTTSAASAPLPVPPPAATVSMSTPQSTMTTPQSVVPPVVSVAPASTPLMTVRQPTVLQLLPQQQYVLNQENGQLIPIVQPGVQVSNTNFTSLPLGQSLGIQQPNFGTQLVDLSSMQPVNVTQLRLSGVPSSMSMILPNGFTLPQASLGSADTTTVSSATSTPVVCAAQSTNASQKILYSTDKGDKEIKYIQGADTVQWTMPGSQTMLIPYQQLQDLTSNQTGLANLQPQQFVSIAPAGGLPQTSLPLSAAQFQQLQASGTIMQLNQKSSSTATKNVTGHEQRGQKRLSDGTPNQLQLRPIAPAGSHVSQEKAARDGRAWSSTARDAGGMKINPAHGTIIHVSSGQQTNVSASGITQDGTGMYIRQIDRNAIQIQSKDGQKPDITTNKMQGAAQNLQMITVPQGMTVLQNPLNISQMPTVIGQPNSQVYMIPANHPNLVQSGLPPGLIGQQVLQPGQNVTVMQPNQLGMPGGVQYNVPLMPVNMPANSQYMQGINLNTQLSAQQLNAALAGQQLNQNLAVSGTIPIVQAPPSSPMTNPTQTLPGTPPVHQIVQNSFGTPTSQYTGMPPQYMMQPNSGTLSVPANNPNVQYSLPANQSNNPPPNNGNGQTNTTEQTDTNGTTNQTNYITSSQENYGTTSVQNPPQQNFPADGATAQAPGFTSSNQTSQNYPSNGNNQSAYNVNQTPTSQPAATYNPNPTNGSNQSNNQNYGTPPAPNTQNASQSNFSPSTTPAPNQNYPTNLPNMPNVAYPPSQNPQNPYPNATGQNLAAYANNQYQYTSRPWFRPRYGSPQGSPYSSGAGPPMPPMGNYNYWQDS
ncbi:serine/threonine-protein kinase WNK1-like isoform X2 [Amyelois transitella]|uniref:serine/threonine-protein kinase WNK1-like isoform X2 n=1 Tax=Amyelois transitella TaxID=680683 RepID=UPI00298FA5AB|nr:serine/threonine-protein kinase WNK1-like isoform X2 [Amyelois transitella]